MNYKGIIDAMLKERCAKKKDVSKKIGKADNFVVQVLKRDNDITLGTLLKISDALDYEIVVRKKNYLRLVEEEMLLDAEEGI